MEQSTLTKELVERAARREGVRHPVISVIDYHAPQILQLNQEYSMLTDNQEQQRYIARNFGFLADSIEEAGDFSLTPLDLVAIWSKAMEVWPKNRYPRYRLAGMVSSAYGIRGVPSPQEWRGFPRYWLEKGELPMKVLRDKSGLLYVANRLQEIGSNIAEFDFYLYGTRESPMELSFNLAKKAGDGDKEAERQLEQLIARQKELEKEPTTHLLGEIHENFGNGMVPIPMRISVALEKL